MCILVEAYSIKVVFSHYFSIMMVQAKLKKLDVTLF